MLERGYNESDVKVFAYVLGETANSPEHKQAASLSVNRIATACGLSRSTIMRSLKRLYDGDLVVIRQNPDWQRHRASEIGIADSIIEKVKIGTSVTSDCDETRRHIGQGLHNVDCFDGFARMESQSAHLVLTDLPSGATANDWDVPIDLAALWNQLRRVLKPNGTVVMFAHFPFDKTLAVSKLPWLKTEFIWVKEKATGFFHAQDAPLRMHETILVFSPGVPPYNPQMEPGTPYLRKGIRTRGSNYFGNERQFASFNSGNRYPTTLLTFNRDEQPIHPTQKPVALLEFLIRSYSSPGDLVCDPCAGSASTAIAAMNTTRRFIGFERNKAIFQAATRRMRDHEAQVREATA
jgi:site-specific DNA-methyltransferase (adenine-specific)